MVLAVIGNRKGYQFVAGNMGLISLHHARRIITTKEISPFINITMDHFFLIRESMDYSDSHIVFTAGVGATVVVKSWQLLEIHGEMVGASYPNHFMDITDKSDEDTVELVKYCINGKHGEIQQRQK